MSTEFGRIKALSGGVQNQLSRIIKSIDESKLTEDERKSLFSWRASIEEVDFELSSVEEE